MNLTIAKSTVRIVDGLYSLNDLHKAAGNDPKHQPALFMRKRTTKELIKEIEGEHLNSTKTQTLNSTKTQSLTHVQLEGRNGGTFVCKELVYAYAMWISAKFHLHVIRAFDKLVNRQNRSDPDFKAARVNSKAVQRTMTDMLKRVREEDGKETKAHHYSNEMLLVNMIFSGKREPLDRDDLTPPQLKRLSAIVSENIWMMCRGISYADRKQRLTAKHQILLAV